MTSEEAVDRLKKIIKKHGDDHEAAHIHADQLLCEILRATGYFRTADIFEKMKKYYG